jgi:aspartate/methionine/tyrosine aminotransferase
MVSGFESLPPSQADGRLPVLRDLSARGVVRALVASQIREVAEFGMGELDILPFWFGEPDEVTPENIRAAAVASIAAGETFYSQNLGVPALREAIAGYLTRRHRPVTSANVAVTSSGVSALMLTAQALVGPGDRVVCVTPLWPNITEIPKILGAEVVRVGLQFGERGWTLDTERLLSALGPGTRAVMINSPNNPTGWALEREAQEAILAHCRKHGIWVIADDVYERLYYARDSAPSFLDLAAADDRVVSINSFSKAWRMTGWRLGWIVAPPSLVPDLGTLIEYNTSCAPVFVQRAGLTAITDGELTVQRTVARFRDARDFLVAQLAAIEGIAVATPPGAMYVFFRVEGVEDSLTFCKRLVREARLGLAPGSAFGPEGEGFVRWCFAAAQERLSEGVGRLARYFRSTRFT